MKKKNSFILQNENSIYYECGYSCDNVIFLSLGSESFFITDARYELEAKLFVQNSQVVISNDIIKSAKKILTKNNIKSITIDPYDFSLAQFKLLSKKLDINFIQEANFSKQKRIIKTNDEIKLLKKAMSLGRDGFAKFNKFIKNSNKLYDEKYLNFKAISCMSNYGKYDLSFDPIVAVDQNSAKPHALPTKDKYDKKTNLLLMDAGIKYKRYCSDRTVTYINKKDKFQQKIYDIVSKAQQTAIKKAKAGMKASKVDAIARQIIDKKGYGKYFVHSTGHGVGLDIHEYPNISSKSDVILEENMVFTIEPGIYLPDRFGIRIEDTVAIQNGRAEIL
jgi:Xaa-Pro aminopeptidase